MFLSNLRLQTAPPTPTDEVHELNPNTRDQLKSDGITSVLISEPQPAEVWKLAAGGINTTEAPSWLLVCSDAQTSPFSIVSHDEAAAALARAGNRYRANVSGNGCADFGVAIALATSLVGQGQTNRVGIASYDSVFGERLMRADSTVRSDGVSYCELSENNSGAFAELLAVGEAIIPHDGTQADRLRSARTRPAVAVDRCLNSIGATRDDVSLLVCNGYGRVVREFLANTVGIPLNRLSPQPPWGHVANADLLIAFERLLNDWSPPDGTDNNGLVLGLLTGPQVCVALALRLIKI